MEENYKLAKWLNDELTAEELASFESEPDYALYKKIRDVSSGLTTSDFNDQQLLAKILGGKPEPKTISLTNWIMRIAAILVVGFGLYFAFNTFSAQKELAKNGEDISFLLPDESEVMLHSGSEISYQKWNWDNNRKLDLTGEAYFKVAKGKKFQVTTSLGKVTVLGTQFNVKARNNRFDISCFEGRVQVNYQNQQIIVRKGQTVAFEGNQKIIDQQTDVEKPYWTIGEMFFDKARFTDVLEEIEREYNVSIENKNLNSAQLFSGKLPGNNIKISLEIIATTYHLRISKISGTRYTLEPAR